MGFRKSILLSWMISLLAAPGASAGVHEAIQRALAEHLGASRVEILGVLSVQPAQPLDEAENASVLEVNARGEARVLVRGMRGRGNEKREKAQAEYRVKHASWAMGWVAQKRVLPGEALSVDALKIQDVNIAEGLAHEFRGAMLSPSEDLSRLEARQTLLEGGFVTTSAVRKIPDLRRGDAVRLEVLSGEVRLSTAAQALENGNLNQRIRVQAAKSKRELVGVVREGGVVEVRL